LRFWRWKQRLEPLPWRVGAFFAFHTGECTPPARVCKHALVGLGSGTSRGHVRMLQQA
jgi:hypothetical protein